MNEGNTDMNDDSDYSSQSVSIDKHQETHLNEEIHSRFSEKHVILDKNSCKIHPVAELSDEPEINRGRKESESLEHCDSSSSVGKHELDDVSSCCSTSKGSGLTIKSVETLNHVESSVVSEKHVPLEDECRMPQMLYNLYTISVSK